MEQTPGDILQCSVFIVSSQKKETQSCNRAIQAIRAWSHTNHGNPTPTRSGFENKLSRQKRSAMGNFSRTNWLPITVLIVEKNTSVNMLC